MSRTLLVLCAIFLPFSVVANEDLVAVKNLKRDAPLLKHHNNKVIDMITREIQQQIHICYAENKPNIDMKPFVLEIDFKPDGNVERIGMDDMIKVKYETDKFIKSEIDKAIAAIRKCTPLKNMSDDTYEAWQYVDMTFVPTDEPFIDNKMQPPIDKTRDVY